MTAASRRHPVEVAASRSTPRQALAGPPCPVAGCGKPRYRSPGGWLAPLCQEHRAEARRVEFAPHPWAGIPVHMCRPYSEAHGGLATAIGDIRAGWWKGLHSGLGYRGCPPECPYGQSRSAPTAACKTSITRPR
jgi:hypothetical protein